MGKNKLKRFLVNESAENIIQEGKELYGSIKGNWDNLYFKNGHPITVELGCGNGEYTIGLASAFPNRNFIGTDIKGARIWKGSQDALKLDIKNAAFLRTRVEFTTGCFAENEVDEIWLTFPDPQLKDNREKHRLTHPRFFEFYNKYLKPNGLFHLKTDSLELFEYTLEIVSTLKVSNLVSTFDLYNSGFLADHLGIQTKYEKKFLAEGKKINYLRFNYVGNEI